MKKLIGILVLFITLSSFHYGSWIAVLECESVEDNANFYAELRDIEVRLEKAVLEINDKKFEYEINDEEIIFEPEKGILIFHVNDCKNKETNCIKFNSIPSTFTIEKQERRHQIYKFQAEISGLKKANEKEDIRKIKFDCRLEYII